MVLCVEMDFRVFFSFGHWMKRLNSNVLKGHNLLHLSQERQ